MTIIKRKTRKKIGKQLKKLVKQHGPEVALGAATALVTTLINKATDKPAKKKDKGEKDKGKKDKKDEKSPKSPRSSKVSKGVAAGGGSKKGGSKKSKKARAES